MIRLVLLNGDINMEIEITLSAIIRRIDFRYTGFLWILFEKTQLDVVSSASSGLYIMSCQITKNLFAFLSTIEDNKVLVSYHLTLVVLLSVYKN